MTGADPSRDQGWKICRSKQDSLCTEWTHNKYAQTFSEPQWARTRFLEAFVSAWSRNTCVHSIKRNKNIFAGRLLQYYCECKDSNDREKESQSLHIYRHNVDDGVLWAVSSTAWDNLLAAALSCARASNHLRTIRCGRRNEHTAVTESLFSVRAKRHWPRFGDIRLSPIANVTTSPVLNFWRFLCAWTWATFSNTKITTEIPRPIKEAGWMTQKIVLKRLSSLWWGCSIKCIQFLWNHFWVICF